MRRFPLLVLLASLVFFSCSRPASRADYLYFGNEAVVLVTRGDLLVVVDVPASVTVGYAKAKGLEVSQALPGLFGLPVGTVAGGSAENLHEIRDLLDAIGQETDMADGVLALRTQVGALRHTSFGATLDRLAGWAGLWDMMVDKSVWRHYDVARFLDSETLDWTGMEAYFRVWLSGALEEGGRRN